MTTECPPDRPPAAHAGPSGQAGPRPAGPQRGRGWPVHAAAAALIVLAGGALILRTRDLGLLGFDTYPLIIASRIATPGDLPGTLTEPLMDGRYPAGFYRPLLNVTFALDYALWGLAAPGYQLTNVLLLAGCAAGLYGLARRALGPGAVAGPLAAAAFFLLHPMHAEVLPVPARRPEALCGLLMAAALAAQLAPRALARARPALLPGVLGLLAMASKETALTLPLLVFPAVLLYSPRPALRPRLVHALLATVPHAVAVAIMLAARLAVLGGLGGHGTTSVAAAAQRLPETVAHTAEWLICPQPAMRSVPPLAWLPAGLLSGLVLLAVAGLASRRQPDAARERPAQRPARAAVLALAWLAVLGVTYAIAGRMEPWYVLLPVAAAALLLAAVVEWLGGGLRAGRRPVRGVAAGALALVGVLLAWQGRLSPMVHDYDEWWRGTVAAAGFLDELRERIGQAPPGTRLAVGRLPLWVRPDRAGPHVRGAAVLTDYSVQAWAELVFPGRPIRVRWAGQVRGQAPAADEVLVALTSVLPGCDGPGAE